MDKKRFEMIKENVYTRCNIANMTGIGMTSPDREELELIDEIERLIDIIHKSIKCIEKDIRWFDAEYASTYGELCNCAGANADRLEIMLNPTNALNILKEAIK